MACHYATPRVPGYFPDATLPPDDHFPQAVPCKKELDRFELPKQFFQIAVVEYLTRRPYSSLRKLDGLIVHDPESIGRNLDCPFAGREKCQQIRFRPHHFVE